MTSRDWNFGILEERLHQLLKCLCLVLCEQILFANNKGKLCSTNVVEIMFIFLMIKYEGCDFIFYELMNYLIKCIHIKRPMYTKLFIVVDHKRQNIYEPIMFFRPVVLNLFEFEIHSQRKKKFSRHTQTQNGQ